MVSDCILPFTRMEAPGGALVIINVPDGARRSTAGSSTGPVPTSTWRCSIWYPGMVTARLWRPGAASSEQGVVHAMSGRPSNVAVAPLGLLITVTGWGPGAT